MIHTQCLLIENVEFVNKCVPEQKGNKNLTIYYYNYEKNPKKVFRFRP